MENKTFKYQSLMDENGAMPCPFSNCQEANIDAFHFGFDPLEDERNFVPGHIRRKQRILDSSDIRNCAYCGLSMYKTLEGARTQWKGIPVHVRSLLKCTHILSGKLKNELGVMSVELEEHFTFFEYEGVELRDHFSVYAAI